MASTLTDRLSRLVKTMRGQARITEDNVQEMLREVRMALLEADVALPVVRDFIARVKEKALGAEVVGSLSPGQALVGIVNRELALTMGEADPTSGALKAPADINLAAQPPAVILMAGLQGAGKTTTTAKLAKHLIEKRKKKVLTVSADVYRPAAIEQLKVVTKQAGAEWFPSTGDDKPLAIGLAALDYAKKHYFDVLLVDTAGRLAIDEALMAEIKELHAALNPVETLFVVDAMQGQDAINTAKAFKAALPLTGIVLTKMDGDAKGGAALSIRAVTGIPIKFISTGEKPEALEPFYPERLAERILGMGDMLSLIEKIESTTSQEQAEAMEKKLRTNQFTLEDFLAQLQQIKKMGPLSQIMEMIPGMRGMMKAQGVEEIDEKPLKRIEAIINSMTIKERQNPKILNGSRKLRIAKGSGTQVQEINQLLKQFEDMQQMMKQLTGGRMGKMLARQMGMGGGGAGRRRHHPNLQASPQASGPLSRPSR